MASPQLFKATLFSKLLVADATWQLTFSISQGELDFIPGQYIWVILPDLKFIDLKGNRRAFSICSSAAEHNKVSILFRESDSGFKKTIINLTVGQVIWLEGPHGSAFALSSNITDLVMISAGVGIAPFLGIIRSLSNKGDATKLSLINFNSSISRQAFAQEIKELCNNKNILLFDKVGKANLESTIDFSIRQNSVIFICGPQGMVDNVYQQLKQLRIEDSQMRFEEVYPNNFSLFNL